MYTMKEACEKTGLSYETLKFYCNQGLVPYVRRDSQNRRIFSEHNITWINSLSCLKNCNMGIGEMREYLALCLQGEDTIPSRQIILERKRQELLREAARIQESITYIDWKTDYYNKIRSGEVSYHTNLVPEEDA